MFPSTQVYLLFSRPLWSPLLYLVAVHHVNAFTFQRIDPEVSHNIIISYTVLTLALFSDCPKSLAFTFSSPRLMFFV